jgi:DNA-binding CsgD family transcriptional regulator
MTYRVLLSEIENRIDNAVARESWEDARMGLRELARILVDATIAGENDLIARIDEMLAQAFTNLSMDESFVPEMTVTALGWSTDGLRDVSQLARRRRPPMTSEQRATVLRDAETRVLALLRDGNRAPRSNREIAEVLGLNVATVARTLAELRKAKKVKSWPEGRFMMNELVTDQNLCLPTENARLIDAAREAIGTTVAERKRSLNQNILNPINEASRDPNLLPRGFQRVSESGDAKARSARALEDSAGVALGSWKKNSIQSGSLELHGSLAPSADEIPDLLQYCSGIDKQLSLNAVPVGPDISRK